MAFVIAMKILNEAIYLPYAIRQFYKHADRIVLIEGVDQYMQRSTERVSSDGLSVDGTTEIIESFPDPEGKIEHVKLGFYQEEEESFQRMMDGLKAGDVLWTAAPDEFFFDKDIRRVKEEMASCLQLRFQFRTYWHDFYHRLRGGGWDNELARVWVLCEDSMKMVGKGVTLMDSQGRDYNSGYYAGETQTSSAILHHFSYVRDPLKIMEKQKWQLEIEEGFSTATKDSPVSPGGLDCYTLKQRYKTPENFIQRNFPFFTNEMDSRFDIYVEKYDGPWPEALDGHEYFSIHWDEEPVIWKP